MIQSKSLHDIAHQLMNKQNVVFTHSGILFHLKKEFLTQVNLEAIMLSETTQLHKENTV